MSLNNKLNAANNSVFKTVHLCWKLNRIAAFIREEFMAKTPASTCLSRSAPHMHPHKLSHSEWKAGLSLCCRWNQSQRVIIKFHQCAKAANSQRDREHGNLIHSAELTPASFTLLALSLSLSVSLPPTLPPSLSLILWNCLVAQPGESQRERERGREKRMNWE